jgi:DnaJ-class molecular chaperone
MDDLGFDPEDLFRDFFGRSSGKTGGGRRNPPPQSGSDKSYTLNVSFLDAALGSKQFKFLIRALPAALPIPRRLGTIR